MFLKMIAASEENDWDCSLAEAAGKLLTIVAIADQEDNDDSQDMAPFENSRLRMAQEVEEYFKKRPGGEWFISKKEQVVIEEYFKELGIWSEGNELLALYPFGTRKKFNSQGGVFTPAALKNAFEELKSIPSRISLDNRRKIMIKHAIADAVNSLEGSVNIQSKKCILFECLAVAYVDNDYSEIEQYTVKCIVDEFQLDEELVDEMIDYINQYMNLYGEIYELITE